VIPFVLAKLAQLSPFGAMANLLQLAGIPVYVGPGAVIWLTGAVVIGGGVDVAADAAVEVPMQ
jgi:hypothetical protein